MNAWTYFDALGRLLPMAMPTGGNGAWPQLPPNPALGPNPFASLPAAYASALAALDPTVSGATYPLAGYALPMPPSVPLPEPDPSAASSWLPTPTPTIFGLPGPLSYVAPDLPSLAIDDSTPSPPIRYDPAKYSMFARVADPDPPAEPQDPYASLPGNDFVRVAATGTPTWPMPGVPIPPQIPPEVVQAWWDAWQKGHQGLADFLYQHWRKGLGAGRGRGGGGGDDDCYERWQRELARCPMFAPYGYRYKLACDNRANDRHNLCVGNGGAPNPNEPPEFDWRDIPRDTPGG